MQNEMTPEQIAEWRREYDEFKNNPPDSNCYLDTIDKTPVKLEIECQQGDRIRIFARAYLPQVVGSEIDWFVRSITDNNWTGWKCVLMPRARNEVIQRFGIASAFVGVKSLKVVRRSKSEGSILCEIHEWL